MHRKFGGKKQKKEVCKPWIHYFHEKLILFSFRWNFFELDKFVYELKTGDNTIKRSSYESKFFAPDRTSYYDLYKIVMGAYNGQGEFTINGRENFFNFPLR